MGKGTQRNQPCHCGSGKKFKKCCMNEATEAMKILKEKMKKYEIEKHNLEEMGIYINYVHPVPFKGNKVWALGNKIYPHRPEHDTFHQFIIELLLQTLGKEWWESEQKKSVSEQHFIKKCFTRYDQWRAENARPENKSGEYAYSGIPDGLVKTLLALAFDVCSLIHTNHLPKYLLKRLRNKNEYQGVRYEIAIAAIFSRLGFKIDFLDEVKDQEKTCEFIATHLKSGLRIAVEAKSRHRPGSIHTVGHLDEEDALKGDVHNLFKRALAQNPDNIPFLIFIDLNSPPTPKIEMKNKKWFTDIEKMLSKYSSPSKTNPDSFNGVIITNYSYHYQGENQYEPGEYLTIWPLYPRYPINNPELLTMLQRALQYYGEVPLIDVDE